MAVPRLARGAFRKGAPFAFLQGLFLLAVLFYPLLASACPLDRADERAGVAYVYDGDTLKLEDGRKVRFIGINTPEISHDGSPSEPFAQAARKRLIALIDGGKVLLRYDRERHDRYGRLLAHPYLTDGRSLSQLLLQEGLAAAVVIPPNLWQSDCYLLQEETARERRRGVWSSSGDFIKKSRELDDKDRGFALLQGKVEEVDESRHSLWLELEGNVALRIPKRALHYFDTYDPRGLAGRRVEARGWLVRYEGKWHMTVGHPNAMRLLDSK
jgi:endonuclease YncB( thermonuclease family)